MGRPREPEHVKLFMGILYVSPDVLEAAVTILEDTYGEIDLRGRAREFVHTSYYDGEMGTPLFRCFLAFRDLVKPDELPLIKLFTNSLEDRFSRNEPAAGRLINLDPGYMGHGSVILATTKNYSHRVYLRSGIYAEPTYRVLGKRWVPYDWTYPDYKIRETQDFFHDLREIYLRQRKDFLRIRSPERYRHS